MKPVLEKLQIKAGATMVVLGTPAELEPLVASWAEEVALEARLSNADAYLIFIRSCAEIAQWAPKVVAQAQGDAIVWFAYPKKSSKRYASDVGRDESWAPLGALGFEGVRQIAIDEDWSALRFRRVEFIRTLSRDPKLAMSAAGKARASSKMTHVPQTERAGGTRSKTGRPSRRTS